MIADEIKKAGQATIDQSVENLVTYNLTNTWTTFNEDFLQLGALACDTGGNYLFDGDFGEWKINFTQDVCRYNGTPVKTIRHDDHGHGDYDTYQVLDFSNNQLYYDESMPTISDFSVRQIEFQNNKQSFQILSSGQPSYTDSYFETDSYSEEGLLNKPFVPGKPKCSCVYSRYLTYVSREETKELRTVFSGSRTVMLMVNAVQSENYDWSSSGLPNAGCDVYVDIRNSGSSAIVRDRYANFTYYNPGNLMMILKPNQNATVYVRTGGPSGQAIWFLCTIQEISI